MKHLRSLAYGALVFAVVLSSAMGIAWAAGAEYDDTADAAYTVDGETQVADVGNWTALNPPTKASWFYDNETVTNSGGTQLTEGTDYEFNSTDGTVFYYNTADVTDGENMTVDYAYAGPSAGTRALFGVLSVNVDYVLPAAILLSLAMTVVGLAIGLHKFGLRITGSGGARFSRR